MNEAITEHAAVEEPVVELAAEQLVDRARNDGLRLTGELAARRNLGLPYG
ncbi:hypothetical protein V1460_29965 [Streptomyces sp. SCSIO 30461]